MDEAPTSSPSSTPSEPSSRQSMLNDAIRTIAAAGGLTEITKEAERYLVEYLPRHVQQVCASLKPHAPKVEWPRGSAIRRWPLFSGLQTHEPAGASLPYKSGQWYMYSGTREVTPEFKYYAGKYRWTVIWDERLFKPVCTMRSSVPVPQDDPYYTRFNVRRIGTVDVSALTGIMPAQQTTLIHKALMLHEDRMKTGDALNGGIPLILLQHVLPLFRDTKLHLWYGARDTKAAIHLRTVCGSVYAWIYSIERNVTHAKNPQAPG